MHYPVTLSSIGSSSLVEDESLPHSYELVLGNDGFVPASRFPKPRCCSSVCASACRILLILVAEEVPLALIFVAQPASIYTTQRTTHLSSDIRMIFIYLSPTSEIPRFNVVQVDVCDNLEIDLLRSHFPCKIVTH